MKLLNTKHFKSSLGFTLMELIVVIGMLAILFAITLVAINPAQQFANARDAQRRSDVNAILNSVHQYAANHNGNLPTGITTTASVIGNGTGQADLCDALVPDYIADLPLDPTDGAKDPDSAICTDATTYSTDYSIVSSGTSNRITVTATADNGTDVISVTR